MFLLEESSWKLRFWSPKLVAWRKELVLSRLFVSVTKTPRGLSFRITGEARSMCNWWEFALYLWLSHHCVTICNDLCYCHCRSHRFCCWYYYCHCYCYYNDYIVVAVVLLQCQLHWATLKYGGACWLGYCAQHGSCECPLFPISVKVVCILQKELLKCLVTRDM